MGNFNSVLDGGDKCSLHTLPKCASDLHELNCLVANKKKAEVCPQTIIDFLDYSGDFFDYDYTILVPDGHEVTCPTSDCVLRRLDTTCPFFTFNADDEIKLKGLTFGDGFAEFSCNVTPCLSPDPLSGLSIYDSNPTENIISLSNFKSKTEFVNVDLEIKSKLKATKKKGGKGVRRTVEVDRSVYDHRTARDFHENRRNMDEIPLDHCSKEAHVLIPLFHQYDTDGNKRVDCDELQAAIGNPFITVHCLDIFTMLAAQECFEFNGEYLTISS